MNEHIERIILLGAKVRVGTRAGSCSEQDQECGGRNEPQRSTPCNHMTKNHPHGRFSNHLSFLHPRHDLAIASSHPRIDPPLGSQVCHRASSGLGAPWAHWLPLGEEGRNRCRSTGGTPQAPLERRGRGPPPGCQSGPGRRGPTCGWWVSQGTAMETQ